MGFCWKLAFGKPISPNLERFSIPSCQSYMAQGRWRKVCQRWALVVPTLPEPIHACLLVGVSLLTGSCAVSGLEAFLAPCLSIVCWCACSCTLVAEPASWLEVCATSVRLVRLMRMSLRIGCFGDLGLEVRLLPHPPIGQASPACYAVVFRWIFFPTLLCPENLFAFSITAVGEASAPIVTVFTSFVFTPGAIHLR